MTYSNWSNGEPNNQEHIENCLHLFGSSDAREWNDSKCSLRQLYPLCMKVWNNDL